MSEKYVAHWGYLNQYERQSACRLIDGYRIAKAPGESDREWFDRSKSECIANLRKQLARVECVAFEDMFPKATNTEQP